MVLDMAFAGLGWGLNQPIESGPRSAIGGFPQITCGEPAARA
jgi:hypothetical protein